MDTVTYIHYLSISTDTEEGESDNLTSHVQTLKESERQGSKAIWLIREKRKALDKIFNRPSEWDLFRKFCVYYIF